MRPTSRSILAALILASAGVPAPAQSIDITDRLETVGQPEVRNRDEAQGDYDLNPWDLFIDDGMLYLGSGDPQGGRAITVRAVNLQSGRVVEQGRLDTNVAWRFREVRRRPALPNPAQARRGHASFFYWTGNEWKEHRALKHAVRCYDLLEYDDLTFAAVLLRSGGSGVLVSEDRGRDWPIQRAISTYRLGELFGFNDQVFATTWEAEVYEFLDGEFRKMSGDMLPGVHPRAVNNNWRRGNWYIIHRATQLGDRLTYIGQNLRVDKRALEVHPIGIFAAIRKEPTRFAAANVLRANATDLVKHGDRLWAVAYEPIDSDDPEAGYLNELFISDDVVTWRAVASFESPCLVRSLAVTDQHVYFGLGAQRPFVPRETGTLLRVPKDVVD